MKKLGLFYFFIACFFFVQESEAQRTESKGFVLSGQIVGLRDRSKIYLINQDLDTVSQAVAKGEYFVLSGKLPQDGRIHFIRSDDSVATKVPFDPIFLENKTMSILGSVGKKAIVVSGSAGHLDLVEFLKLLDSVNEKRREIGMAVLKIKNAIRDSKDSNLVTHLNLERIKRVEQLDRLKGEESALILKWISNHTTSFYAPRVISKSFPILLTKGAREAYNNLNSLAKESYYGAILKEDIERNILNETVKKGAIIPNFQIKTPGGEFLYILDIAKKNKFTLIDFWASWCAPCRAEIPELKKLYHTYKGMGLNIVGVSSDSKEGEWLKALQEDGATWEQGIQNKDKSVTKLFDLKAIPAYILIDSKGKIVAFDCAMSSISNFGGSLRGEELQKKLEGLFASK